MLEEPGLLDKREVLLQLVSHLVDLRPADGVVEVHTLCEYPLINEVLEIVGVVVSNEPFFEGAIPLVIDRGGVAVDNIVITCSQLGDGGFCEKVFVEVGEVESVEVLCNGHELAFIGFGQGRVVVQVGLNELLNVGDDFVAMLEEVFLEVFKGNDAQPCARCGGVGFDVVGFEEFTVVAFCRVEAGVCVVDAHVGVESHVGGERVF